jgi:hypothetical protein
MAPKEFYIRSPSETEARGPFNLDQVTSLAEAGQVTAETLYYDATNEKWVAIGDNAEVKASVFPEKKKLSVKKDLKVATLNKENDSASPITVTDMLAAAEGRTEDTKDKSDPAIAMARAAKIGMWACIAALVCSAVGEIVPSIDAVMTMDPDKIIPHPLVFLGAIDIFLSLMLILGVVTLYPFVRFRAALGIGFIGLIYWTQSIHTPLIAVVLGSIGLYLCTIFVRYLPIAIATALALAGMGGFAWLALTAS